MDDLLTSAEAARLLGVGATAIKRWSDSGSLTCIRTPGGHRRFSRSELERLRRGVSQVDTDQDWSDWLDILVRDGGTHLLHARLQTERGRTGSWHRVAVRLGDLLAEVGRRWADGQLTVIEEHVASAALHRALATVCDTIPVAPTAPRCLLASVEGDVHTLGLSLAELCLREAGWRSEWAGAPTRTSDVTDRVSSGTIDLVALSASATSTNTHHLAAVVDAMATVCRPEGVGLVLGGSGAWPEPPSYGVRFRSLPAFYQFALEHRRPR